MKMVRRSRNVRRGALARMNPCRFFSSWFSLSLHNLNSGLTWFGQCSYFLFCHASWNIISYRKAHRKKRRLRETATQEESFFEFFPFKLLGRQTHVATELRQTGPCTHMGTWGVMLKVPRFQESICSTIKKIQSVRNWGAFSSFSESINRGHLSSRVKSKTV